MATITGTSANESLTGTSGDDTISGLGGNDTLNGNGGVDFYDGGAGFDSIDLRNRTSSNLIVDFESGNIIAGGVQIGTFTGVERVQAGTGNDSLLGTTGGQNLAGQGGQDTVYGAAGIDTLWGGAGNDHFLFREAGSANADRLSDFASGADKISLDRDALAGLGAAGNFAAGDARFAANASGTAQDASDRVIFETDTRQIWYDADGTGAGARQLIATLQAGATLVATDIVISGNPTDGETIVGTEGDDTLVGGPGNDTISGLGGDDFIIGDEGDDLLDGGAGNDEIDGIGGDDTVLGGAGNDLVTGRHVSGGDGNDVLNFETLHGPDTLDGGAGDDIFYATTQDVLIDSGGIDTVRTNESWTLAAGFENLDFDNFTMRDDGLPGLEGYGNELANRMQTYGGNGGLLDGRGGDDTLIGGGRDGDTLFGGTGNDVLEGVGMFDRFMFTVAPGAANADQITDFTPDSDKVVLDGAVHANLGSSGNLTVGDARFWSSGTGTAHDADDRVLYNSATGQLWHDADGTGVAARQLIATLQGAPAITATDMEVINGSAAGSVITGTSGNDTLSGTAGDDTINGLSGDDSLYGGDGADLLAGGDGDDTLNGVSDSAFGDYETSVDTLHGGLGNDLYDIEHEDDVLADDGGTDTVRAHDMSWTLGAGFENLVLRNDISEVSSYLGIGNELDNHLSLSYAGGRLEGRGGNDTLVGAGGEAVGSQLLGGDGADSLIGSQERDTLEGGAGADTLDGGTLDDGASADVLTGGAGADTFAVHVGVTPDQIIDFSSGTDKLRLDGNEFSDVGASGNFVAGDARFHAAAGATGGHDADDRVIFNTTTGEVFYDEDGNGIGTARLIGVLPALAATDIVVINGGNAGQVINGTDAGETLFGGVGNDTINGLGGNDTLSGSDGSDVMDGGTGDDFVHGGRGADLMRGSGGNDTLSGEDSDFNADSMDGGAGNDWYSVFRNDVVLGDAGGVDTIDAFDIDWTLASGFEQLRLLSPIAGGTVRQVGTGNNDDNVLENWGEGELYGLGGNDSLRAFNGTRNVLDGGAGADTLTGAVNRTDEFHFSVSPGAANADTVVGFAGANDDIHLDNVAHAGLGAAGRFSAGDARFTANATGTAQDGSDRVVYNTSTGQLWFDPDGTGSGAAQLIATLQGAPALGAEDIVAFGSGGGTPPGSTIIGTAGNDTLTGTAGNDTINGLGGNDLILAGSTGGSDVIDGGAGNDSIEFKAAATSAVIVNFNAGTITGGSAGGSISFTGIERVVAGNFNDSLSGTVGSQNLAGQAGADTLTGGAGNDTLWGGTGNDAFRFNGMGTANADRISDFASGQDKVQLEDTAFTAIGALGNFAAGDARFWASSSGTAHDSNDRVLYNTSTGQLYYDADGNGGGAAQLIATLINQPAISATDIAVI